MLNISLETLKVLGLEAIDEAKSGHPGIVLGAANIIHTLYTNHIIANSEDSTWINRDRFILSAGHGSALLYSNLHLANYKISLNDLKAFRSLNSITPGHPEVHLSDGVDASSGPLGQGLAQAVGMAIAEAHLGAKFPKQIDHYTYVICGDGDLQEGISQEALSFAGHLNLNKLIVLFDSNDIQLDGPVKETYSENLALKMKALNWNYILVSDGENTVELNKAIKKAKKSLRPTLIEVKTIIGLGSSKAGSSSVHGSPLNHEEVLKMRQALGGERFTASKEAYLPYRAQARKAKKAYKAWIEAAKDQAFIDFLNSENIDAFKEIPCFELQTKEATRVSSGKVLKQLVSLMPNLIGGSADLSSSTHVKGLDGDFSSDNRLGRNIKFGVREHAMAAICNGISLHGGLRAFCGGFFVFADYLKPALRFSALMELDVIYIFTHDSIAVGEDGPSHQPIEQLTMLRSIPNLTTIRPADANELRAAYVYAIKQKTKPVALVLTRQDLVSFIEPTSINLEKGAYIVKDSPNLDGIIIASGSELALAYDLSLALEQEQIFTRVVSIPSVDLFEAQSKEYKEQILPSNITKRLAIEMSDASHLWKYVGLKGDVVSINSFGKSAKGSLVIEDFGFTVSKIIDRYKAL